MASVEKEFFWGCELSKDKKEYSWDSEDEELSKADIEQKLVLSQACLAAKAKPNERNVVEVTTIDASENSVTYTILSLQCGKTEQCRLSLGFPSSVVFKLVEGSGPVHLTGSIYQELYLEEGEEEDSDEDEKPIDSVKPQTNLDSKKRPLAETPKGPPKKLARVENALDKEESDDDEEDEDEDEEESSEEAEKMDVDTKKKENKPDTVTKAPSKKEAKDVKKGKAKDKGKDEEESEEEDEEDNDDEDESDEEESEEEGSDDDDDDEEDDDEEDDEDDEEGDDESEEEDEVTKSLAATKKKKEGKDEKKPVTNGVAKQNKAAQNKEKPNKTPVKQQPSTPKTGGKKDDVRKSSSKSPQPMDMEQIKEKLKKTPSLPKKLDRFKNFMKSSYKVTDDSVITNLWDWLKENK